MGEAGLRPQPCPTCCDRNGGRSPLATLARCEFATAFNAAWRLALSAADHQPHFCSRGQWARARLSSPEESSCIQLPKKELVGYRSIEAAGPGEPRDEIGPGRDRTGVPLFRIDFFSEDDGGSSYRPSFLDVIDEGGGGFFLPLPSMVRQRRCAFSGLSRSATWLGGLGSCGSFQGLELRSSGGRLILPGDDWAPVCVICNFS
ncbi:hypothetical protein PVAP13_2NG550103 [Panicum virgatum]|uniref:Uncharacterized protein n=1 Tax=Panicum virgatum TaxID=38727 RepID=A0A8T0VTV0_PANVG|nr:hypothetical protein PVAP13_2NG550103 [Panicum virgatum]